LFLVFVAAGDWPHNEIKNIDIIRMHSACVIMDIDAHKSIYYMATTALGKESIKTDQ